MDMSKAIKDNYLDGKIAIEETITSAKRTIMLLSIFCLICGMVICGLLGFAIAKHNTSLGAYFGLFAASVSLIAVILCIISLSNTLHRSLVELGRLQVKLGEY